MDNMKPLIDAVSEDRREEAATDNEAGRPDCRGAREGGQRGSSCGRHGRSGPPLRARIMLHMGPTCGASWGPPCGPSCGRRCGPRCEQPGGPPFMCDSSGLGLIQCWWNRGPSFMHGPNAYGPMVCPWGTRPVWADMPVHDVSDEVHAGNAKNAGKQTHDPQKQQDGVGGEKSGQQCPRCPWVDRMRRRRMRHANVDCRRHDPCPMAMYRRCRRGFGAPSASHCPPWSNVPSDCCHPEAPMGWGECPYPPPFFRQFDRDSTGESNSDPENDNQKQGGGQKTREASCPFSQGPSGFGDRWRQDCHGHSRWQCGPPRNKLYKMLAWKRKVLKEKLQRIESHLERLQSSEEETKEAMTGEDGAPEQASSMSTAPEAVSPMDTYTGERTERGWEVIAESEWTS